MLFFLKIMITNHMTVAITWIEQTIFGSEPLWMAKTKSANS
jgi:hypothetical protein